jgi:outer membrane protein OmpA-like peptidoglycan-associated protein
MTATTHQNPITDPTALRTLWRRLSLGLMALLLALPATAFAQDNPTVEAQMAPFDDDARLTIAKARTALEGALAIGAEQYAPGAVAAARERLQTAEDWVAQGRSLEAVGQARLALHAGIAARVNARPTWRMAQAREAAQQERAALLDDLTRETKSVLEDEDQIEVPVFGAFKPQSDRLSAAGRARLEALGDIARRHKDFQVVLSAHSAESLAPTDALLTAQSRAQRARDWLSAMGVERQRIRLGNIADASGRHLTVRFEAR